MERSFKSTTFPKACSLWTGSSVLLALTKNPARTIRSFKRLVVVPSRGLSLDNKIKSSK